MIRAVLLSVVVFAAGAAWADADDAYRDAKEAYQKLKGDQKRRALRHHWQNVAKKFDAVAAKYPRSDRAPEALFNSGELYNELSRFSAKDEDRESASRAYRKLMDGWPKHKLADDAALSLARMLANHEGDVVGARKVIEGALKNAGDKKKDLSALLATFARDGAKARAKLASEGDVDEGPDVLGPTEKKASPRDARTSKKSAADDAARDEAGGRTSGDRDDPPLQAGVKKPGARPDGDRDDASPSVASRDEGGAKRSGQRSDGDRDDAAARVASRDELGGKKPAQDRDDPRARSASRDDADPAKRLAAKKPDEKLAPPMDVAEAIRRAIKPLEAVSGADGEGPLTAQARRLPALRPPVDERGGDERTDDVDEGDEPVVASLAERLRDVRVGARKPVTESEAKSRLKQLMKADAGSDLSLAQQLGLKVRRVIIDAGHGGHDTGAIGPKGTREKDVALAIALKLGAQLQAAGLEVVFTRDDDTFVKLEDRTRFANKQKGDLFISIHCNSAPTKTLRGVETYTLNTSSNRYSIRLAARENATTERGVGDLQYILADLATKANTGESTRLAERVQRSLVRDLSESYKGVKDLGNKEALFFVLLGARMPAILVETSFLSHPEEEERLADDAYQQKIADSIAESVTGFLEERNKLAQVD